MKVTTANRVCALLFLALLIVGVAHNPAAAAVLYVAVTSIAIFCAPLYAGPGRWLDPLPLQTSAVAVGVSACGWRGIVQCGPWVGCGVSWTSYAVRRLGPPDFEPGRWMRNVTITVTLPLLQVHVDTLLAAPNRDS